MESTTSIGLAEVLNDPPKLHSDGQGKLVSWALHPRAIEFIHQTVGPSCTTLETGCGLSTVVFALAGSRHTVIAPVAEEMETLKAYCRERQISVADVRFIPQASQTVLPGLEPAPLDLVLIDGGHGFPTPYIDWFYTAGNLKKGGYLIVDDVMLWSCQILHDFLMAQPQWQLVDCYDDRTSVFRKLDDGAEWLEWTQQPLVARSGRMKWIDGQIHVEEPPAVTAPQKNQSSTIGRGLKDLQRGNVKSLAKKIGRRVRPYIHRGGQEG